MEGQAELCERPSSKLCHPNFKSEKCEVLQGEEECN